MKKHLMIYKFNISQIYISKLEIFFKKFSRESNVYLDLLRCLPLQTKTERKQNIRKCYTFDLSARYCHSGMLIKDSPYACKSKLGYTPFQYHFTLEKSNQEYKF